MNKIINKKKYFLFYDYETFGTNFNLDKPSQFSCVRTDQNFNIIKKYNTYYCFPPNDYLPNIDAILLNKITPQITFKKGINEFYFSKKIYSIFNKKNTCILGFNNIQFDDEFTRNIFYRNLLDPYSWSYRNNNSKWDVLNLVRACFVLRPEGIIWPIDKFGFVSLKLENLVHCNKINDFIAHDSLSDVFATIKIANLISLKQPKLFNFFFKNRLKNNIINFINYYKNFPILYISSFFGKKNNYFSVIKIIFQHPNESNIWIAFDLSYDIKNFLSKIKKINFEQDDIKTLLSYGLVLLYINKCPILSPINVLRKQDLIRLNINIDLYLYYNSCLNNYLFFLKNILKNYFSDYIFKKKNINSHVDSQIYENFFNFSDLKKAKIIHTLNPKYFSSIKPKFLDSRMKKLFFNIRARNFFNTLNLQEKNIWIDNLKCIFNKKYILNYYKKYLLLKKKNLLNKKNMKILHFIYLYFCKTIKYTLNF
ncbi:exodeoxyribonuclease I [Buchnera aphidicola (Kurisakia onigurumii)]|uniref:exodeoxyribonuclease I n=1 Tax=Buchnera aphidicola TaxID=9 RepID=UPI0031B71285